MVLPLIPAVLIAVGAVTGGGGATLGGLGILDFKKAADRRKAAAASSEQGDRLVYSLDGRSLLEPAPKHPVPSTQHVEWHSRQVFKSSA